MNLRILQSITPIKVEDGCCETDASFRSTTGSDCSYFNIPDWGDKAHDVSDNAICSVATTMAFRASQEKPLCSEAACARKALFSENSMFSTSANQETSTQNQENLSGLSQEDCRKSKITTMQTDAEDFSDIWKNVNHANTPDEMPPSDFSFPDNNGAYGNLTLDNLPEFQQFSAGPGPSSSAQSVTTDALTEPIESSGYQCSPFQSNDGLLRTYSNDLGQPITQQTNMSQGISQMGLHHMNSYQSNSPNSGEGSGSTHNSPFTPSPSQRFDYPTSPHAKPSIPSNTDYPGDYIFSISFGEATESAPKSAQYTFSHSLNKLFVKMNVSCPIHFKCETPPPMGCTIRAVPVFKRPEHVTDVVTRCPNHKIPDEASYAHRSGHLIRAEMPDHHVRYDVAVDMRESVSVHFERPQIGAEYTTILYKFMCLSSCVGGINRRPLNIVFELKNQEGQVLGRRVVEVRICSCPGRDRAQEEKRKFSDSSVATSNGHEINMKRSYKNLHQVGPNQNAQGKKRRAMSDCNDDQEEFVLKIRGRDKFLMLKRVKEALDLMEYVTPQQQEEYRNKEEREQACLRPMKIESPMPMKGFPKKLTSLF